MSASGGSPFYTTVTRIKDYESTDKISLVTLPAGTVLFRGIRLPTENHLSFYTDFLGVPSTVNGMQAMCLKPTHNVFFYAHPLVCFGAHNVGSLFDSVQVVVLVKDVTVVCMIRPSTMVRGEGKRYSGSSPIQRCSNFKEACSELSEGDIKQLSYDNCLSPAYQRRSSTRGWMAIANLDSIEPKLEDEQDELKPTMGPYLKELERRHPGVGSLLVASTYVDATKVEKGKNPRTGFPEIVLYPYATPPADTNLLQPCSSDLQAMALIAKQAKKDNLLYLPLVTITAKGIVDMIGGDYSFDRIRSGEPANQPGLEGNVTRYLNTVMRYGMRLPFYGNGAMSFDMRTGFYIMPQVASQAYRANILPVDSNPRDKKREKEIRMAQHAALRKYLIKARMYSEDTYEKEISLPTGPVPNKFIFARPTILAPIFKSVGIRLPVDMIEYLKELSEEFRATRPVRSLAGVQAQQERVPPILVPESRTPQFGEPAVAPAPGTPQYGPGTPQFGPGTPQYGPGTPQYGPASGAQSPAFRVNANSPPFVVGRESPPFIAGRESPAKVPAVNAKVQKLIADGVTKETVMGGYGQPYNPYGLTAEQQAAFFAAFNAGAKRGGRRVTARRGNVSGTRKRSNDPLKRYAQHFSSLWKMYAKGKKN